MKQAIYVLADRVLVSQPFAEGERQSRSGILIPATAQVAKRLTWADVVAVGPNVRSLKGFEVHPSHHQNFIRNNVHCDGRYVAKVEVAKELIAQGDIFQVVR